MGGAFMAGMAGPFIGMGIPELVILIVIALVYIVPIVLIASYARKKGYPYWLFLLLGLFGSCVIQGIVALLLPDKRLTVPPATSSKPEV